MDARDIQIEWYKHDYVQFPYVNMWTRHVKWKVFSVLWIFFHVSTWEKAIDNWEVIGHFAVEGSDFYDQFSQAGTIRGFCLVWEVTGRTLQMFLPTITSNSSRLD